MPIHLHIDGIYNWLGIVILRSSKSDIWQRLTCRGCTRGRADGITKCSGIDGFSISIAIGRAGLRYSLHLLLKGTSWRYRLNSRRDKFNPFFLVDMILCASVHLLFLFFSFLFPFISFYFRIFCPEVMWKWKLHWLKVRCFLLISQSADFNSQFNLHFLRTKILRRSNFHSKFENRIEL